MTEGKSNGKQRQRRYDWPADKITAEDMTALYKLRLKTGAPCEE